MDRLYELWSYGFMITQPYEWVAENALSHFLERVADPHSRTHFRVTRGGIYRL